MKNKVAFISGGLGDIGSAIAVAFGRQGMRVAMCDEMDETQAQPRLDELKLQGLHKFILQAGKCYFTRRHTKDIQ